jgi:2-polyprenyl-3-methyl-5-hydroxy-6-metoxy-1,4-benzoquinol methylase
MPHQPTFLNRVIATFTPGANDQGYSGNEWTINQRTADGIVSLLEARPPARILDLACGCGPATTALALQGFDVTGIDCTPASIEIAQRMSKEKGASTRWLCEDMRTINYHEAFDYVCLRDVIFGVFDNKEEDADLIRRISLALKPSGRCLFEVYNKEFALRHGIERQLFYDEQADRFVPKEPKPSGLTMRLYAHDEWRQMLSANGLRIIKMDGWNWKNDPPPPPWRADFIVAQREPPVI